MSSAVAAWSIDCADVFAGLSRIENESVQCVVTSPPYWGLRDYGAEGQIGLEASPGEYVDRMTAVFREVRRVLKKDGTLWLNLGDSYIAAPRGNTPGAFSTSSLTNPARQDEVSRAALAARRASEVAGSSGGAVGHAARADRRGRRVDGLKPKDLVGIPWRVAFALQADGWYLRQDLVWSKPNPMPESVTDRCTKAHEYLFLMSRSRRYYFDAAAIAEPATFPDGPTAPGATKSPYGQGFTRRAKSGNLERKPAAERGVPGTNGSTAGAVAGSVPWEGETRNKRSVWVIATTPFPEAHFATFPEELPRLCISAGSKPGDRVLDPFAGAGTTLLVANRLGREALGIELNPDYVRIAERRIHGDAPLLMGEASTSYPEGA